MKSISIPFVSEAKSSPPSSMNHWLLFVEPAEWGAKGLEMGGEKAKNSARNGGGHGIFSHKKQGHLLQTDVLLRFKYMCYGS